MSIASAIQNAQAKVAAAYTAISNKGGTLPATQNLSNLPAAIESIQDGTSVEEPLMRVETTYREGMERYDSGATLGGLTLSAEATRGIIAKAKNVSQDTIVVYTPIALIMGNDYGNLWFSADNSSFPYITTAFYLPSQSLTYESGYGEPGKNYIVLNSNNELKVTNQLDTGETSLISFDFAWGSDSFDDPQHDNWTITNIKKIGEW